MLLYCSYCFNSVIVVKNRVRCHRKWIYDGEMWLQKCLWFSHKSSTMYYFIVHWWCGIFTKVSTQVSALIISGSFTSLFYTIFCCKEQNIHSRKLAHLSRALTPEKFAVANQCLFLEASVYLQRPYDALCNDLLENLEHPGIHMDVTLTPTTFLNVVVAQIHTFTVTVFSSEMLVSSFSRIMSPATLQKLFRKCDKELKVLCSAPNSPDFNPIVIETQISPIEAPPCHLQGLKDLMLGARYRAHLQMSFGVYALILY